MSKPQNPLDHLYHDEARSYFSRPSATADIRRRLYIRRNKLRLALYSIIAFLSLVILAFQYQVYLSQFHQVCHIDPQAFTRVCVVTNK